MKKRMFLLPILLLISISTNVSATDVSGDVWGEWTSAGNPYNVLDDLRVREGDTLIIRPGCYILFQGFYRFKVEDNAILLAIGSESDSITFTAYNQNEGWRGFDFDNADPNSKVSYCTFKYMNSTSGNDAVIKIRSSGISVDHNSFSNNACIYVISNDNPDIIPTEFNDNTFAFNNSNIIFYGGGPSSLSGNSFMHNTADLLIFNDGEINVERNIFKYNSGTILYAYYSPAYFKRNVACFNSAYLPDAASVFVGIDAEYHIENNTVCFNSSTGDAVGEFHQDINYEPVYMKNNIFWGNSHTGENTFNYDPGIAVTVTYTDIQGGWSGVGNIDADPMFVDSANGDFHLLPGSPCIDTGDPASPLDPDSTRADMGALYFDQTTRIIKSPLLPREITLYQNYPNPFNAGTIIKFDVIYESRVSINVYDLLGRRVSSIVDAYYRPGTHEILWNGLSQSGKQLPTGIYLYKLKTDTFEQTRKMMLLK